MTRDAGISSGIFSDGIDFNKFLDKCKYLELVRHPDRWWPWCLDDHAIIVSFQGEPSDSFKQSKTSKISETSKTSKMPETSEIAETADTAETPKTSETAETAETPEAFDVTWSIVRARDARIACLLLGGACQVVLGRDGVVLDLAEALAIVREYTLFRQRDASHRSHRVATRLVRFIPEWEQGIESRIAQARRAQARARRDGGLWHALLDWSVPCIEGSLTGSSGVETNIPIIGPGNIIADWVEFLRGFAAHVRSTAGIDLVVRLVTVTGMDSLESPVPEGIDTSAAREIHGEIIAHDGSICIVRNGDTCRAIDMRDLIGYQPVSFNFNDVQGIGTPRARQDLKRSIHDGSRNNERGG
ncbi:MAG: hypothetical protein Q6370_025365 [Candidatus Sigynarchaeota archaeon]